MKRFVPALIGFGLIISFLGITAYVKLFSYVTLPASGIADEESIRVIYSPARIREALKTSPIIQQMREAQRMRTQLSKQLASQEKMYNQMTQSKTAEAERVAQLYPEALILEFPEDTNELAAVPPDKPPVVQHNSAHPALDTKQLQQALGISYAQALKLKWNTSDTILEPGVSYERERGIARDAAIRAISHRFEAELAKKYGKTERDVQADIKSTQALLAQTDRMKSGLEDDAFKALKNTGTDMTAISRFRVRRKSTLLIFKRHHCVIELTGAEFWIAINTAEQCVALNEYLLKHL